MKKIFASILFGVAFASAFSCGAFKATEEAGTYECVDYTAGSILVNAPKNMTTLITRYENGAKNYELKFVNGVQDGVTTRYYMSGEVMVTTTYEGGWKHGMRTQYWPNGNVMVTLNFVNDQPAGNCNTYTEDGELASTEVYENGSKVKTYYYESGELIRHAEYGKTSTTIAYYEDGAVVGTEVIEMDDDSVL